VEKTLSAKITSVFRRVFEEQNEGHVAPDVSNDTKLLETGLDSLGFAILVVRLEEELGFDPFVLSSEPFYPSTFGEFVAFYEANQPK